MQVTVYLIIAGEVGENNDYGDQITSINMQSQSWQKRIPWLGPFAAAGSLEGRRRISQQRRGCLAPERLESRLLLSFSPGASLGGGTAAWTDFNNDGWVERWVGWHAS